MRPHNPGDRRPRRPSPKREPERTAISIQEVQHLLNDMAAHRDALAADAETLQDWLAHSTDFMIAWRQFAANGGLTGQDFVAFVQGRLQRRPTRTRRHLRLIVSKNKAALVRRKLGGNDAA